ncbi:MAG TPA: hypothetical protein VII07_14555, partial [Bradyrhizobium sp.]
MSMKTVIPGRRKASNPESRDSGFVAAATPRNDGRKGQRSGCDRPDRFGLRLLPMTAQFGRDL